ncbi:protein disulfide isomerase pTAC5, chloroplastic [Telopea speciosissima]|uniref:protein disulfide isomerase pTAC5, chloroplastic n=1 Tax=Telopea speciosissima TaxID=54955 RepID=UPI001CC4767A|nr:protein disulfide isomerase pTAC5, chloroplastic [Telopea speciosissima]
MESVLPLRLQPPPRPSLLPRFHCPAKLNFSGFQLHRTSPYLLLRGSPISATNSSSSSNPSNWEREEIRWLREEQRWLREEQRWIGEEARWDLERESLLREIADLKLRIQALERENSVQGASVAETVANMASLLQVLKDADLKLKSARVNQITESGTGPAPMLLESESEEVKEMVVEEIRMLESNKEGKVETKKVKRKSLRKGSEGEDVRAMQEALSKLGFYSGEEDIEYSSFSSGTERAVKTWQATLGGVEDGIMTAELLERLYMEQAIANTGFKVNKNQQEVPATMPKQDGGNGAAVSSMTEFSEIQQTVVKESGTTEVEVSQHRVFLLGENRWEEPSRLVGKGKKVGGSTTSAVVTKCPTCRGEGHLLCMECDGTGEPNIEPQFMEWVDEGANCPYCEGRGYSICDTCDGKG